MAESSGRIGSAYVELKADPTKLQQDLNAARTEVEREAAAMGQAADKEIGGGFDAAGRKIQESTAGVRRLSSAISSVAGIFTSMVAVVGLVAGGIAGIAALTERWLDGAKRTREEILATHNLTQSIEASFQRRELALRKASDLEVQIFEAQQRSAEFERQLLDQLEKKVITQEQYLALRDRDDALLRQEIAAIREAAAERARQREADYQAFLKQKALESAAAKEAEEKKAREAAEIRERERLREEQKAKESADRQAKALADALERAISKINTAQTFQQNIAGPIEEILNGIRADLQSLKFGGRF